MMWINIMALSQSVHVEQSLYYRQFGPRPASFYDSLDGFSGPLKARADSECQLNRIVFGFHPYWTGSDYLAYQWNLLSDLCYFSYEVDPSSGDPVTIHEWLTDPAVDSAKAHDVRVHLCATIFSGHSVFFNNPASRQNLIDNLISLVNQRNADGINLDIEAVPSSVSDSMTAFIIDLSAQMKTALPGSLLSLDLPAVDWNNDFQVGILNEYVDYFFLMGYDYYWNGSSQAGPVSPLYAMVSDYNYSLARSMSDWESKGLEPSRLLLGVPYYGRQWKTASDAIPSPTLSNGSAITYSNIRNNGSIYSHDHYRWEQNSFSSCYVFFQNDNWNQCFIGLDKDLRKKYDLAAYRDLAGIGIWALGYDHGYPDLWQAIEDKFTDCSIPMITDTVFDSGGPVWNYYSNENYRMSIGETGTGPKYLTFMSVGLEEDFDSLWIYDGPDPTGPLLGALSGGAVPGSFIAASGVFTLRFQSDPVYNFSGWSAVYHDGTMGAGDIAADPFQIQLFPNPAKDHVLISSATRDDIIEMTISDAAGKTVYSRSLKDWEYLRSVWLDVSSWEAGFYFVLMRNASGNAGIVKLVVQ